MEAVRGMNSDFTKYLVSLCQHHASLWGFIVNDIDPVSTLTCYITEFAEFLAHEMKNKESK